MATPVFRWYKKPAFDAPELNSPQPCAHGSGCNYTREGKPACCAFVHPGEEGSGRHLFPERTVTKDGVETVQKECVRLTGGAGYYERRRLRLSWPEWCERQGIPYKANPAEEGAAAPVRAPRQRPERPERPVCTNCSKPGHSLEVCWAPGGPAHKAEEEVVADAAPVEDGRGSPVPMTPKTPRAPRKPRAPKASA